MAADVAVDGDAGLGRDGGDDRLARTGVVGVAGDGADGDADLVLRAVPARVAADRVPQQLEVEALAADEFFLHLRRHRLFLDLQGGQVDVQGAVVVALDHRLQLVGEFLQDLVGLAHLFDIVLRFRWRSWFNSP